jgi:hypothetical protein
MTRNQLLPKYAKNLSGGVMFTVDGGGNIKPTAQQLVNRGETILTQRDTTCNTTFTGQVCARQNDVCQCSTLVGVSSGSHMVIGTDYTISSSVTVGSEFEIYAVTDSDPVPGATNGDIHVNG